MNYKLTWLENISDDNLTNTENEKTWKEQGFKIENDGENYEITAIIEPNNNDTIQKQALLIIEQYSKGLGNTTFSVYDIANNIVFTEEDLE